MLKYILCLSMMCFFSSLAHHNILQDDSSQIYMDAIRAKVEVVVEEKDKSILGQVDYEIKILEKVDSIFFDAQKMIISNVSINGNKVKFEYDQKRLKIDVSDVLPSTIKVHIDFISHPEKAVYFLKHYNGSDQVWTQGQGKNSSNWLPSFDDMSEKVEYDLSIIYKKGYEVIANGNLIKKEVVRDSLVRWDYDMQKPMSSYLLAFVIGKYHKIEKTSRSGIPMELYYYPDDEDKVEPTYRYSEKIFDFLEEEIGFAYPWQNYKQIPVKDFLHAGMENTGTTIFTDEFVVDSTAFVDRNYINVNAHELAHQWFGNLITEKNSKHHWLQEGFATYYALLAEREVFGEDYFLYKLYESAEQLTEQNKTKKGGALLNPKATSLTFYQHGAWALYALNQLVGKANFKIAVHNYLQKFQFKNVITNDFLEIVSEVSGTDLTEYRKLWLEKEVFPSQQALDLLTKFQFIKDYLGLAKERTQPLAGKWSTLAKALQFPANDYLGQEAVYQLGGDTSPEAIALLDQAFETNNILVRQALANTIQKIPGGLQKQFETLLEEKSYATIEPALYQLWAHYPKDRKKYLDKTKNIKGFHNHNVRILWLVLALSTKDYNVSLHQQYFEELVSYTFNIHHFSTRRNALQYIDSLGAFSDVTLRNLVEGTVHPNWRFAVFCRKLLTKLGGNESYKAKLNTIKSSLPVKQQNKLEDCLKN